MAHSFAVKGKTKRWPLVILFNIIDLAGIAGSVIWFNMLATSKFSHEDNRQSFLIQIWRELALEQVERCTSISTIQSKGKTTWMMYFSLLIHPVKRQRCKQPQHHTNASAKQTQNPYGETNAIFNLSIKNDRKSKMICAKCSKYIFTEHSTILCYHCVGQSAIITCDSMIIQIFIMLHTSANATNLGTR